jgi:hypothetical protein
MEGYLLGIALYTLTCIILRKKYKIRLVVLGSGALSAAMMFPMKTNFWGRLALLVIGFLVFFYFYSKDESETLAAESLESQSQVEN